MSRCASALGAYVSIFASADGRRTAAIARLTGTPNGLQSGFDKPFDVCACIVCTWTGGVITEQYRFVDAVPAEAFAM
ncbi:MAG: hypothetical protein QM761_06700 [Pseudoxanthomonas sp.]